MAPFNEALLLEAPLSIAAAYSISLSSIVNLVIRDISHMEVLTISNLSSPQKTILTTSISAADTSPKNSASKLQFVQLMRCGMAFLRWKLPRNHSMDPISMQIPKWICMCRSPKSSDRNRCIAACGSTIRTGLNGHSTAVRQGWSRGRFYRSISMRLGGQADTVRHSGKRIQEF